MRILESFPVVLMREQNRTAVSNNTKTKLSSLFCLGPHTFNCWSQKRKVKKKKSLTTGQAGIFTQPSTVAGGGTCVEHALTQRHST